MSCVRVRSAREPPDQTQKPVGCCPPPPHFRCLGERLSHQPSMRGQRKHQPGDRENDRNPSAATNTQALCRERTVPTADGVSRARHTPVRCVRPGAPCVRDVTEPPRATPHHATKRHRPTLTPCLMLSHRLEYSTSGQKTHKKVAVAPWPQGKRCLNAHTCLVPRALSLMAHARARTCQRGLLRASHGIRDTAGLSSSRHRAESRLPVPPITPTSAP